MGQKGLMSLRVLSLPLFSGDITSWDITKFLSSTDFEVQKICRLQYRRTKDLHFRSDALIKPSEEEVAEKK
jgi:hypothetical protein